MGMIWSMATPSVEDRQTQEVTTPYKWSDYVHKVSSIMFGRHGDAERIICVNNPCNAEYSTKDDERDLRVQGKAHVPNTYMKLVTPSPQPQHLKHCYVMTATGSGGWSQSSCTPHTACSPSTSTCAKAS